MEIGALESALLRCGLLGAILSGKKPADGGWQRRGSGSGLVRRKTGICRPRAPFFVTSDGCFECGVRSAECGMRSGECGCQNGVLEFWSDGPASFASLPGCEFLPAGLTVGGIYGVRSCRFPQVPAFLLSLFRFSFCALCLFAAKNSWRLCAFVVQKSSVFMLFILSFPHVFSPGNIVKPCLFLHLL